MYATQQDLIDRFSEKELIQLTDQDNRPPTTINSDTVTKALDDATALADSYVAKRYSLPLNPVPRSMTRAVSDVARYYLHGDRADEKDPVRLAYKDAVSWFNSIAKGITQLEADGVEADGTGGGQIRFEGDDREFSRDSLKDF